MIFVILLAFLNLKKILLFSLKAGFVASSLNPQSWQNLLSSLFSLPHLMHLFISNLDNTHVIYNHYI